MLVFVGDNGNMIDRSEQSAKKLTLRESREQDDAIIVSDEERWRIMWELARQGWLTSGGTEDEFRSRLRRDVGRVVRRER